VDRMGLSFIPLNLAPLSSLATEFFVSDRTVASESGRRGGRIWQLGHRRLHASGLAADASTT